MRQYLLRLGHKVAYLYYRKQYKNIFLRDETRDIFESEIKQDIVWPENKKFVCNLQFDDFCAKSKSNAQYDFGGSLTEGINLHFDKLLSMNPFAKVTIFTIPQPTYRNFKGIYYGNTENLYNLSNPEYAELVSWMKSKSNQVEIACHGLRHVQYSIPFYLSPAEFEFSAEEEAERDLKKSLDIFSKLQIATKGFKPPAWGIGENNNFEFLKALKKFNFEYVCLSSPYCGLNWSQKRVSNVYPQYFDGMLNIPQNVSLAWSMERIKITIDKIASMNGIVTLMGHYNAEFEWMEDGVGPVNNKKITEIFSYINNKYGQDNIWYANLFEVAKYWKGLQK